MTNKKDSDDTQSSPEDSKTLYRVMPAEELEDGDRVLVQIQNIEVVIINNDSELYAFSNYCTHQGGPMCEGKVLTSVDSDGEGWKLTVDKGTTTISCPWHGWEYNINTGEHMAATDSSLPTYNVIERAEDIYVEL